MKHALYPLTFHSIPQERIWGGRKLEQLYQKALPAGKSIGETWEISDRPDAASIVANGPLAGTSLRSLMEARRPEILGKAGALNGRFPLLVKILDAREKLSLQVHPPASKATSLGGEPKTEMWYITEAAPQAELFVGLRREVNRESFAQNIQTGTVEDCFHKVQVKAGDAMFLPSGRVHAIGGGLVIFEIQQNSDTTYRVFDWNRRDAQGNPRPLHVKESLECIDFQDFEPSIISPDEGDAGTSGMHLQTLVDDPLFKVEVVSTAGAGQIDYALNFPRVVGVVAGRLRIHGPHGIEMQPGQFCLLPASLQSAKIEALEAARFLVAQPG